jgi:pimeloyl-[acyl-carrier protein] methyl ester esterase
LKLQPRLLQPVRRLSERSRANADPVIWASLRPSLNVGPVRETSAANSLVRFCAMAPARVLLLPGLDGTGRLFRPLLDAFPSSVDARVIAYPNGRVLSADELAAFVSASIDPAEAYWLVAESFSGPIALQIASQAVHRPDGLVLAATFTRAPVRWLAAMPSLGALAVQLSRAAMTIGVRAMMTGRDAPPELVAAVVDAIASVPKAVLAARIRQVLTSDVRSAAAIRVPTLIISARRDRLVPSRLTAELRASMPHAEHVEIDAPHLVLQRFPIECAEHIASFIARHGRDPV